MVERNPGQEAQRRKAEVLREIDRMYARLDSQNHFQLLSVDQDTPTEHIKNRFLTLAKKWHSDAYNDIDLGPAKSKVETIFKRISTAHQVLTDPSQREEYVLRMQRDAQGISSDIDAIFRAEQLVDQALIYLGQKQWGKAQEALKDALSLHADDPLYDAHLAWAVFNQKKRSEAAASEAVKQLKAAVKRRESMPVAYQYLGQIYFHLKKYPEAKKWWRKCLEWDGKNLEASRGIRLADRRAEQESSKLPGWLKKIFGK